MSASDDFFFTGGGFSDWSGGSAGRFSSGGRSSSGGGSNQPGPNDWKYGCGCMVVVVIAVVLFACWDTIYYKWFYREDVTIEQCDTIAEKKNDFVEDEFKLESQLDSLPAPSPASNITRPSKSSSQSYHSSLSYYYDDDDEYDEDGMYKDEDEDIKDKRQYDDYDDDEADDWE